MDASPLFVAFFMKQLSLANLVIRQAMVMATIVEFGIKFGLVAGTSFVSLCDHMTIFSVVSFILKKLTPYFKVIHSKLIILLKHTLYIYIYREREREWKYVYPSNKGSDLTYDAPQSELIYKISFFFFNNLIVMRGTIWIRDVFVKNTKNYQLISKDLNKYKCPLFVDFKNSNATVSAINHYRMSVYK